MADRLYTSQYIIMVRPRDANGRFLRGLTQDDRVYARGTQANQYIAINGEPWIKFSVTYSLEDARRIGAQAAGAIGADNVLVLKVVPHEMRFQVS